MKFTSEIIKKAWSIRKAAAAKFGCPVSEISWRLSLKMAVEAGKEEKMTIKEAIMAVEKENDVEIFSWYGVEDIEGGQEFELKGNARIQVVIRRGKLEVSGKGFKSYFRKQKAAILEWKDEISEKLGLSSQEEERVYARREVESCDGGYQEYRY